jgi:hypothetical protein
MFRVLAGLVVVCLAIACGGNGDAGSDGSDLSASEIRPQPTGKSLGEQIEEAPVPLDIIEGFEIKPYFDKDATVTELAVSPGGHFEFYVVLSYPEPYYINALEYRLELPAGVSILAEKKFSGRALTIGDPLEDFTMAYECMPPGSYDVMKYFCEVGDEFAGGEIKTTPGMNKYGTLFLGTVTCKGEDAKLPAAGGVAVLKKN